MADISDRAAIDPNYCFVMRFSFLGRSGWKSDFSQNAELLFEETRLKQRLKMLRQIPLPSLKAQTDQNFHLFVLTSTLMPEWALADLQAACAEALDTDQFSIVSYGPAPARRPLRYFVERRYGSAPHVQIALDDDDAVARTFVQVLRDEVSAIEPAPKLPRFFSFPLGYGLSYTQQAAELYLHRYPFINLGLSMVTNAKEKNILAIDHQDTPRRKGCKLCLPDTPMFVRTVHDYNDSRVSVGDRWQHVPKAASDPDVLAGFPWLPALFQGTRHA